MIKITQLLNTYNCTYNEVDELLSDIQHYKTVREQKEFNTIYDFIKGNKSRDIGNEIVDSLNDISF